MDNVQKYDRSLTLFTKVEVPYYSDFVKHPIHFGQILSKLNGKKYSTMGSVLRDIGLIWSNSYLFNGKPDPDHPTQFNAFANWIHERECLFNEYVRIFTANLTANGWISSQWTPQPPSQWTQYTIQLLLVERRGDWYRHTVRRNMGIP